MYNIYLLLFVLLVIAFFDIYWILRLAVTRLLSKVANYLDMQKFCFIMSFFKTFTSNDQCCS